MVTPRFRVDLTRRTLPTGMGTGTGMGMGTDTDTDTGMVRLITPGRRQQATTLRSTFPCRSVYWLLRARLSFIVVVKALSTSSLTVSSLSRRLVIAVARNSVCAFTCRLLCSFRWFVHSSESNRLLHQGSAGGRGAETERAIRVVAPAEPRMRKKKAVAPIVPLGSAASSVCSVM